PYVAAVEDPRYPAPALLPGAVRHKRRADECDADAPEQLGGAGPGELLVVDRDLRDRRPPTPVLGRPVHRDPSTSMEAPLPVEHSRCLPDRPLPLDTG